MRGHRTGRGGGWGATGLLRARGLCHFFVRSRVACVVPPLLWCVLHAPVAWLRRSQSGGPRGARVRLVGWPLSVSGAGAMPPCLPGGAFEGFVSPPPVRVAGRLRVPLAACPRRSVPPAADPLEPLNSLLTEESSHPRHFRQNIRKYNAANTTVASMEANADMRFSHGPLAGAVYLGMCTIVLGRSRPGKDTPQGSLRCTLWKWKTNTEFGKDLPLPCPFGPKFCGNLVQY